MVGFIEKIKNFFSGKVVCKVKKPAQPTEEEEPQVQEEAKPQQQESREEESKTEHEPF